MKIDPFKTRTQSNPLVGVTFHAADKLKMEEAASVLATLDDGLTSIMRSALSREILHLEQLGDWTSGEAETLRMERLENAIIAYQATYEANTAARFLKSVAQRTDNNPKFHTAGAKVAQEACTCRCQDGRHCGGCGHEGCGYSKDAWEVRA